jgi:hypothetical protein
MVTPFSPIAAARWPSPIADTIAGRAAAPETRAQARQVGVCRDRGGLRSGFSGGLPPAASLAVPRLRLAPPKSEARAPLGLWSLCHDGR